MRRQTRRSAFDPLAQARPGCKPACAKPAVQLTDEQRARIEKERAKAAAEEKKLTARKARIEALERGDVHPAASKGLPTVVGMNELGLTARALHRAALLFASDEVKALDDEGIGASASAGVAARLRDAAMTKWIEQYQQRVDAGAADNETLHPLGLIRTAGDVAIIEKKPAKKAAAE